MIPLAKPLLGRQEIEAAGKVIRSGWVIEGPQVKEFERRFAAYVGAPYAVAVSNGTSALHLALLVSGVKPGDVVLTVSHSFIATANCIRYCGAEPVFVDIETSTYNMDPVKLEECLKHDFRRRGGRLFYKHFDRLGRLSAILVVHQLGMPCDLRSILSIAKKHGLKVVEDAACAIGSEITVNGGKSWKLIGKPHGDLACFSFHPRKVITTAEGGMITTADKHMAQELRLLRSHGRNIPAHERISFKKTKIEDYVAFGYNYRMTDIQAAIGIVQLGRLSNILATRRRLDGFYRKYLSGIENIKLPFQPKWARTNWQSYPLRLTGHLAPKRDALIEYLYKHGIASLSGVTNAHAQKPYLPNSFCLPESEIVKEQTILLPLYAGLKENEIRRIAQVIKHWSQRGERPG
jgi:dTDP-4-amino-4,6-dideoxygalactose transaminase